MARRRGCGASVRAPLRNPPQRGGGIFRSQRLLEGATDDEVMGFARSLAAEMLRKGTTTFETKSGYGLTIDNELRQLRLARALAESVPQTVVTTCLAAHACPPDKTEGEWIGEIARNSPSPGGGRGFGARRRHLRRVDRVPARTCQPRLKTSTDALGLRMRMHADQLEDSQAAAFAARWGLNSADHLNHTSLDAVGDLVASDTAAVLLPGATFTLRQNKKPPARNLVDEGAIVALGSDLNPGTSRSTRCRW